MGRSAVLIGLLLLLSAQWPAAEVGVETLQKLPAGRRRAPAGGGGGEPLEKRPAVQRAAEFFVREADWILQQQIRLTSIPAPPFHEEERARYLEEQFRVLGLENVRRDATLLFAANVGEEGEGNLRGMQALFADGALRRRVRAAIAIDGSNAERLTAQALGSKRFQIVVRGPGGPSWADFGLPNPIQALARAITRRTPVQVPAQPRPAFNVGEISGGTAVNAIPYEASVKVDIRSEMESEIERLEYEMRGAGGEGGAQE